MLHFKKTKIFHTELADGLYQLSSTERGYSREPGKAGRNSYLISGSDKAVLFDLALTERGLIEYSRELVGKPVEIVLSHAHIDHIFHIEEADSVTLHPDDRSLLCEGTWFQKPVKSCPPLRFINGGDTFDLGGRELEVIHIPGHTDGSILLYDRTSKLLLSGDTVARRLLYGLHTFIPFDEFCLQLEKLNGLEINGIYSCHDRCMLPKESIRHEIEMIEKRETLDKKIQRLPGAGKFITYNYGKETDIDYFNMAVFMK